MTQNKFQWIVAGGVLIMLIGLFLGGKWLIETTPEVAFLVLAVVLAIVSTWTIKQFITLIFPNLGKSKNKHRPHEKELEDY